MDKAMLESFRTVIMDDMSNVRPPRVGDRYASGDDRIELVAVSEPLVYQGRTDYVVVFDVIEAFTEDSSVDFRNEHILFGDLVSGDAYILEKFSDSFMNDLFSAYK